MLFLAAAGFFMSFVCVVDECSLFGLHLGLVDIALRVLLRQPLHEIVCAHHVVVQHKLADLLRWGGQVVPEN
eukprot:9988378-Alexandrium_andersonii.AAC.1